VGGGECGIETQGFADDVDGLLVLTDLVGDDAEEVQRLDVARIELQDLAIDGLGLRQIAGLMVLQGDLEHLREGLHCDITDV
jgi:hypothetical protein